MASRSCVHCHQEISEFAQVCPRCGAWEPFTLLSPSDTDVAASIDLTGDQEVEETRKGWLGGLLKDVALQYAIGCGGFLAAIVVVIVMVIIVSSCGSGASGYNQLECQDYYDGLMPDMRVDESSEVQILSITANEEKDQIAWNKSICPGVMETTKGKFKIWTIEIEETSTDWFFESEVEWLGPQPIPVSPPAPGSSK